MQSGVRVDSDVDGVHRGHSLHGVTSHRHFPFSECSESDPFELPRHPESCRPLPDTRCLLAGPSFDPQRTRRNPVQIKPVQIKNELAAVTQPGGSFCDWRMVGCYYQRTAAAVSDCGYFPTQCNVLRYLQLKQEGPNPMSRLSFFVLIAIGVTLTFYFAAEAWRVSDGDRIETTGGISHH
jgi:hypothetical protein